MTDQEIAAIYQELDQARVILPTAGQVTPTALAEKLQECRTWQDRVISISVAIMQAVARAKKQERAAKALLPLSKGTANYTALQGDLQIAQDTLDDLRALEQAVRVVRANLKGTDSDIRLRVHLLDQQIRLGEVQPPPSKPVATDPPSFHAVDTPLTAVEEVFSPPLRSPTSAVGSPVPETPSAPILSQPLTAADPVDIAAFLSGVHTS